MRYSQSEKMEIIRLVEDSDRSMKQTLVELGINKSTFFNWYKKYKDDGYEGLRYTYKIPQQFWNEIPPWEKEKVLNLALHYPEKSSRELAWYITDHEGYFISESSVYRLLKSHDLLVIPDYRVLEAYDKFPNPTKGIHELWQIDFTYFKIVLWGWYYLSTIIDDYSRYIIAWRLCKGMTAGDVKATLDDAIAFTGIDSVPIVHRPRLLSDNGSAYISGELADYLEAHGMTHTRGKPYHPMTQGKIERYHRSMKNVIKLQPYYSPSELEDQLAMWVAHYNNFRYHEALNNVTPADVYHGRDQKLIEQRRHIKRKTLKNRKIYNQSIALDNEGKLNNLNKGAVS